MKHFAHQAVSVGAWGAAIVLVALPARSAPKKPNVCAPAYSAYRSAVAADEDGRWSEARSALLSCAEAPCGALSSQCKARYRAVGARMPSIILVVTDEAGTPRADVEVKLDGELLTSHLDGMGLPIQPGLHELSLAMDGAVFETEKIMVLDGQHNRIINIARQTPDTRPRRAVAAEETPSPKTSADPSSSDKSGSDKPALVESSSEGSSRDDTTSAPVSRDASARGGGWAMPRSPWPYVLGGVGVAAVAAGGLLTYWGNKDNTQLENQCSPSCKPSDLDHVRTLDIASDISFGAGLAALGITTWIFASSHAAEKEPAPSVGALAVAPIRSGAVASLSGAF